MALSTSTTGLAVGDTVQVDIVVAFDGTVSRETATVLRVFPTDPTVAVVAVVNTIGMALNYRGPVEVSRIVG